MNAPSTKPAVASPFDVLKNGNGTTPAATPATAPTTNGNGKKKPDGAAVSAEIVGPILTITFLGGRTLTLDSNGLAPDIAQAALMHGLKQKLIDGAAIGRSPVTGLAADINDKYEAVHEILERITAPEPSWNKVREGGASPVKGGMLLAAMMEVTRKPREELIAYLDGRTNEEKLALRGNPRIAAVIERLQAEKAAAKAKAQAGGGVDSDAMLAGLMGGMDDDEANDEGESSPGLLDGDDEEA